VGIKIWKTVSYYADKPGAGQVLGWMVSAVGKIPKKAIRRIEIFIEDF
jgi:hypothetical protein